LKLVEHGCHVASRKFSFSFRVVDTWNSLSENIIACDTLNKFKSRLECSLFLSELRYLMSSIKVLSVKTKSRICGLSKVLALVSSFIY
jgi:hypothetical protein